MPVRRFSALILAAGCSSRMAGFKPLLRIGENTLIEHAIALFRRSGIEDIVTVVGHRAQDLLPVVQGAASRWVINPTYHEGMFSSIQQGVGALGSAVEAFFLLPVDIPLVQPATVRQLVDAFDQHQAPPVCYPRCQSRRGHPPLIHAGLNDPIRAYEGPGGMRGFLRGFEERAVDIGVEDPFIHLDADTDEDLAVLRESYSQYVSRLGP